MLRVTVGDTEGEFPGDTRIFDLAIPAVENRKMAEQYASFLKKRIDFLGIKVDVRIEQSCYPDYKWQPTRRVLAPTKRRNKAASQDRNEKMREED